MEKERIEADVLCVGGGIAGLMAAIRAAELGANVLVVEKANVLHSGAGGAGNDHFLCYIPEVHGPDMSVLIEAVRLGQEARAIRDPKRAEAWIGKSFDIVKLWDSWGIPMKYNGKWEFAGHAIPGTMHGWLKYHGLHQKPILTEQALKRGVKIVNRVMVFDLLGDAEGVTGALGAGTREDKLIEFQAKSVVLGTGALHRLFPGENLPVPGNWGRISVSGDGRAMAYRLGAELFNMEGGARTSASLKYFTRAGKGTWIGVFRDAEGRAIGKYMPKPDKRYSDMIAEAGPEAFARVLEAGRGPIYMDVRGASIEDIEYMKYWHRHEGNITMLDHLEQEGVDLTKHQVEFDAGRMSAGGGGMINANEKTETSIKGLYAAGDETYACMSNAAVFGWHAGDNAAPYARKAPSPNIDKEKDKISRWEDLIEKLENRKHGPDWQDANASLNNVMVDYMGLIRSETMLQAGLDHLRRLKTKVRNTMLARDRWELTRCLEVLNLYDLGELAFTAALEKKESRGGFRRLDYPYTDPLLNGKTLVGKMVDGKPVVEWK